MCLSVIAKPRKGRTRLEDWPKCTEKKEGYIYIYMCVCVCVCVYDRFIIYYVIKLDLFFIYSEPIAKIRMVLKS